MPHPSSGSSRTHAPNNSSQKHECMQSFFKLIHTESLIVTRCLLQTQGTTTIAQTTLYQRPVWCSPTSTPQKLTLLQSYQTLSTTTMFQIPQIPDESLRRADHSPPFSHTQPYIPILKTNSPTTYQRNSLLEHPHSTLSSNTSGCLQIIQSTPADNTQQLTPLSFAGQVFPGNNIYMRRYTALFLSHPPHGKEGWVGSARL